MSRISLGTSISALNSQRWLTRATSDLNTISERLSSGQRINRASDDAAGLSISSLLNADRRVFNQGVRNINDGLGYLAIAEGAMSELSSIVIRVKELAEQSANGTLGTSQRLAIQQESDSLTAEYNRVVQSTKYNSSDVFSRANRQLFIQGGYGLDARVRANVNAREDSEIVTGLAVAGRNTSGVQGNSSSQYGNLSADGRYLVFSSDSTNLVAGDTNGQIDLFRKDLLTGEILLVSTGANGQQGNASANYGAISADGRYVAFLSSATNLVAGDTNGQVDVFRKDLLTGEIIRVSTATNGQQGNSGSSGVTLSADGRYVAFYSDASNLVAGDTNGTSDVFRKDVLTGEIVRVSTGAAGQQGNNVSNESAISADGRYVSFTSNATNLVAGDTNGTFDIFRKDLETGGVVLVSAGANGQQGNGAATGATISADGRYVAFQSSASNLVGGDTNGQTDFFRKDVVSGEIVRVSVSSEGTQGTGGSVSYGSISGNGRFILFLSAADNLDSGDNQDGGAFDLFVHDMLTGMTELVGKTSANEQFDASGGDAYVAPQAMSYDGRIFAVDQTATDLASIQDTNGYGDVYVGANTLYLATEPFYLGKVNLETQASARAAFTTLDNYLTSINKVRSNIGSSSSRLETGARNLSEESINFAAAESRIRDADVAEEAASYTKMQIIQRSAAAVLAQTNQEYEIAIRLIKPR